MKAIKGEDWLSNCQFVGMPNTVKIPENEKCGGCVWCWEKSLITKNPEDDGNWTCYCSASGRYHNEHIEKQKNCRKFMKRKAKYDPR